MDKPELWEKLQPALRRYVVSRNWDTRFLRTYLDVEARAVAEWCFGIKPTTGERMIRLWYVLEVLGFPPFNEITDSDVLPSQPYRYLGKLLALRVATPEELFAHVGLARATSISDFYLILRAARVPKSEPDMAELTRLYQILLAGKIQELRDEDEALSPGSR